VDKTGLPLEFEVGIPYNARPQDIIGAIRVTRDEDGVQSIGEVRVNPRFETQLGDMLRSPGADGYSAGASFADLATGNYSLAELLAAAAVLNGRQGIPDVQTLARDTTALYLQPQENFPALLGDVIRAQIESPRNFVGDYIRNIAPEDISPAYRAALFQEHLEQDVLTPVLGALVRNGILDWSQPSIDLRGAIGVFPEIAYLVGQMVSGNTVSYISDLLVGSKDGVPNPLPELQRHGKLLGANPAELLVAHNHYPHSPGEDRPGYSVEDINAIVAGKVSKDYTVNDLIAAVQAIPKQTVLNESSKGASYLYDATKPLQRAVELLLANPDATVTLRNAAGVPVSSGPFTTLNILTNTGEQVVDLLRELELIQLRGTYTPRVPIQVQRGG
ncbi:MAG: hypothetical protein ACK5PF_04790, partial [bacterium]